jgi:hypothetical protein
MVDLISATRVETRDKIMDMFIKKHAHLVLISLTGLFAFRVSAQLVETIYPVSLVADFEQWYSGAITYHYLLPMQLVILLVMIAGIYWLPRLRMKPGKLDFLCTFSVHYFSFMFLRLVIALSGISTLPWFQLPLPALFHLVLASYLFCITRYISQNQPQGELACTH